MGPKKRSKVNRSEKEKPLLTVQGVLRLEKSFVPPRHEDAEELVIKRDDTAETEVIKLVPGQSEHDLVEYKSGYDVGPANPFPMNDPELKMFEEQKKVDAMTEAFEELKRKSEEEKKARMEKYRIDQGLPPEDKLTPEDLDPDNPKNYQLPMEFLSQSVGDDVGPPGEEILPTMPHEPPPQQRSEEVLEDTTNIIPSVLKLLPDEQQFGPEMALSVALEMEEKRRKNVDRPEPDHAHEGDDPDADGVIYSLDEMQDLNKKAEDDLKIQVQGPEMIFAETVDQQQPAPEADNTKNILESYWSFVRENRRDFNGWTYLLHYVETIDIIEEVRTAYKEFLHLYPYCYAYWMRYSDIERRHENWSRALLILHRGLEAIPLSAELWLNYLELYHKMYKSADDFDTLFTAQCERAIQTVGLDFRSDVLWERYIEWELERKNFKNITSIYRRVLHIPTRLYNRHWDNFLAHVRDHHPRDILEYDQYEELRKATCVQLELVYRPDPPAANSDAKRDVLFPEDKLKAGMKERIVAMVLPAHERCEVEVEKRIRFEDKIKRTYFHVRPLDLKQLKNWDAYLDFEMEEGDHDRVVVLFERCLIPAAAYEQFWVKYARYLELYAKRQEAKSGSVDNSSSHRPIASALKKARWAFGTGLEKVDDLRSKRSTWTLKGWKRVDDDGNEVMVAEEVTVDDKQQNKESEAVEGGPVEVQDPGHDQALQDEAAEIEMSHVLKTVWSREGRDSVRDVFTRACLVHCPNRAMVRLKWAAFEEECGDMESAKKILNDLNDKFPLLLECSIQLIDIERRQGDVAQVEDKYKKLMKRIPHNRKHVKTWVALKLARFQFKVLGQPEKALATLRSAVKKDQGDARLYSQITDICYQRHPVDVTGVTAAIELALVNSELTNLEKLKFAKRKVEFMQEFGDIRRYRDAVEDVKKFRKLCSADLKEEERKKKELEKEEQKMKELQEFRAQTRANANLKAKIAETEGRLLCTQCHAAMLPDEHGEYEFERAPSRRREGFNSRPSEVPPSSASAAPKVTIDDDEVLDLMEMEIPEEQEEEIRKTLQEKTKYKEVAPTWELNIETYGYGKRRKAYDPDYEHVESAKFREYERLETQGYDEELKDADCTKIKSLPAPGLGSSELKHKPAKEDTKFTQSDYVVPPKVPQLLTGQAIAKAAKDEPASQEAVAFELPPEIADLTKSPCVNVPDWFVKEGGELCLSDTSNGISVLRYWPKFLSEKGNHLMFNRLRRYCKWHQKQVKIGGQWKYETRLVAWYGPCDYVYSGLMLEKNLNWAPELLDLLHRLMAMTRHEFNSCFMNLYRHGHDMCGWHADVHPQLGRNPPVASVSLGAVRAFELRRKSGSPNFIRFPLFPGSLLLMEGAVQEDWLHCIPRDVTCKEERINLTFRIMYSIDKR